MQALCYMDRLVGQTVRENCIVYVRSDVQSIHNSTSLFRHMCTQADACLQCVTRPVKIPFDHVLEFNMQT